MTEKGACAMVTSPSPRTTDKGCHGAALGVAEVPPGRRPAGRRRCCKVTLLGQDCERGRPENPDLATESKTPTRAEQRTKRLVELQPEMDKLNAEKVLEQTVADDVTSWLTKRWVRRALHSSIRHRQRSRHENTQVPNLHGRSTRARRSCNPNCRDDHRWPLTASKRRTR